ncbi:hypothetical protein B7494_g4642 [Chlorociboria aeruginascens]|nr:hypothetical protein B7494_g4642 [Chlorociboria aeruginascens]
MHTEYYKQEQSNRFVDGEMQRMAAGKVQSDQPVEAFTILPKQRRKGFKNRGRSDVRLRLLKASRSGNTWLTSTVHFHKCCRPRVVCLGCPSPSAVCFLEAININAAKVKRRRNAGPRDSADIERQRQGTGEPASVLPATRHQVEERHERQRAPPACQAGPKAQQGKEETHVGHYSNGRRIIAGEEKQLPGGGGGGAVPPKVGKVMVSDRDSSLGDEGGASAGDSGACASETKPILRRMPAEPYLVYFDTLPLLYRSISHLQSVQLPKITTMASSKFPFPLQPTTPEIRAQYSSLPWATSLFHDPTLHPCANPSRSRKSTSADSYISRTLQTADTIRDWQCFFRAPCADFPHGELLSIVTLGRGLCGHIDTAHGGSLSSILDELLGFASETVTLRGKTTMTAFLKLEYKRPVAVPGTLLARAWIERREGRKLWGRGTLEDGKGGVYTTGEALFLVVERTLTPERL